MHQQPISSPPLRAITGTSYPSAADSTPFNKFLIFHTNFLSMKANSTLQMRRYARWLTAVLFLLVGTGLNAQITTCTVTIANCPPALENPYCANTTVDGVYGSYVTWAQPDISYSCTGTPPGGVLGMLYENQFNIPASKDACWTYNRMSRVGSDNVRIGQSSGTGNPTLTSTTSFLFQEGVPVDMTIGLIMNVPNTTLNVYLVPAAGGTPILAHTRTNLPTGTYSEDFTGTAPETTAYFIQYEFIGPANWANSEIDYLGIDALIFATCAEGGAPNFSSTVARSDGNELGDIYPVGTTTVTYTAILRNTNGDVIDQKTCSFDVIVVSGAPTIQCPTVQTSYNTDAGVCTASLSFAATVTEPQCEGAGTSTLTYWIGTTQITFPYTFPIGSTIVTARADNGTADPVECTFTVVVVDNEDPVITCPAPPTVYVDANCSYTVPDWTGVVTATDNCSAVTVTQSVAAGTVWTVGTHSVTFTATDAAGNTATCTIEVTVEDNIDPVITCPVPPTVYVDATCSFTVPDWTGVVTATDNCSGVTVTQSVAAGTQWTIGSYPVTFTATDAAGNTATCEILVTVENNNVPVITCPAPFEVEVGDNCTFLVPDWTGLVTASSACGGSGTVTVTQDVAVGSTLGIGTHTITFTATDAQSNTSTCQVVVTVVDNTDPVINCPAPPTVYVDATCSFTVPDWTGVVTATDNCPGVTVTQSVAIGTVWTVGTYSVTFTATDAAGNTATCTLEVTVADNIDPVITCPAPPTVYVDATCSFTVPDWTGVVTATDNCPGVTVTQSVAAGTVWTVGSYPVTFTATDAAGNTATCEIIVTVVDNIAPVITSCGTPQRVTVETGTECAAPVPDFTTGITVTDNCTTAGALTITQSPAAGTMVGTGVYDVTITVTDASGNETTCTTTFTVIGISIPTITTCAAPATLYVGANCMAMIPNLTGQVTYTTGCGEPGTGTITQSPAAGTMVGVGQHTVTITVTTSGGSATCNVIITVADNTPPVITCPAPVSVETCETSEYVTLDMPTATDNCGEATVTFERRSDGRTLADAYPIGITTVWYRATDASGNTATCSTTVTVQAGYLLVNYYTFDQSNRSPGAYPHPADETFLGVTSLMTPDALTIAGLDGGGNASLREQSPGALTTPEAFKQNPENPALRIFKSNTDAPGDRYLKFSVENAGDYGTFQLYFQTSKWPSAVDKIAVLVSNDCNAPKEEWMTAGEFIYPTHNQWYALTFDLPASLNGDDSWCFILDPVGGEVGNNSSGLLLDNIQVRALNMRPAITCSAANITVTSTAGECTGNVTIADPTVTDDCGTPVVTAVRSDNASLSLTAPFPVGTTTVIFTATDAGGLTATCTTQVTVVAAPLAVDDAYGSVQRPLPADGNQSIGNILTNDKLCVTAGTLSGANICNVTPSASNLSTDVWIDAATGNVMIAPGAAIGTYSFQYTICVGDLQSTATVTVNVDYNLPVTGLILMGNRNGKDVKLNWRTTSEINTSHFIVERSFDGINFSSIPAGSRVGAAGNSNAQRNYYGDDLNVTNEIVFYRVKLFDKDGSFRISNVVAIRYTDSRKLRVYPNPVVDFLVIDFPDNGKYQVEMYGINGQLVKLIKDLEINNGMTSTTIQKGNLAPGNYNIRITNTTTGKVDWARIIIQARGL